MDEEVWVMMIMGEVAVLGVNREVVRPDEM